MDNPSFLALDRSGQFLHTVHGDAHPVSAFFIDKGTGKLAFLNSQPTKGSNPVRLSLDPINAFMLVANHATSSLAVLPRRENGSLGPARKSQQHCRLLGHGAGGQRNPFYALKGASDMALEYVVFTTWSVLETGYSQRLRW